MRASAWMIIAYGRGRNEDGRESYQTQCWSRIAQLANQRFESVMLKSVAGMLARGAPLMRPRKHPAHAEHREEYEQRNR